MARKRTNTRSTAQPTTFVGTFYDAAAGVYVATRKDGTITVGRTNRRGTNVRVGAVAPNAAPIVGSSH